MEVPEGSTVGVIPNVSQVQGMCKTMYASVASHAGWEESPATVAEDVEMGRMGSSLSGPPRPPLFLRFLLCLHLRLLTCRLS